MRSLRKAARSESRGLPLSPAGPCRRAALPLAPSRAGGSYWSWSRVSSMKASRAGVDEPLMRFAIVYGGDLAFGRSCSRATRVALTVTPIRREEALYRGVGFDPSLGRKAIAQRLKRDVRFLGPRGLQKITGCGVSLEARWPPCPTRLARAMAFKALQPLDGHRSRRTVILTGRRPAAQFAPLHRLDSPGRASLENTALPFRLASAQPASGVNQKSHWIRDPGSDLT